MTIKSLTERGEQRSRIEDVAQFLVESAESSTASIKKLDFRGVEDIFLHRDSRQPNHDRPIARTTRGLIMTGPAIKRRARTMVKRIENDEYELPYRSVDEWDMEELAKGRPKNAIGTFVGRPPAYVTRAVHEAAMQRFQTMVRSDMNTHTIKALSTLEELLESKEVDDKGKPIVPPSTRAEIAKFLLEHIVGKPKQHIETDISVKLQGILGHVMVTPDSLESDSMKLAHLPGVTMPMADARDDDDEYIDI